MATSRLTCAAGNEIPKGVTRRGLASIGLPVVDAYRTMGIALEPAMKYLLEDLRRPNLAT